MWYFTWILGIGLALAFGVINVMWLEAWRLGRSMPDGDEAEPREPSARRGDAD